jgi:hypothetical protein
MNIPFEFLLGFGGKKPKPTPIQAGDTCRNKDTGTYSKCLSIDGDVYYGRMFNNHLTMGLISKFEKI